MAECSWVDLHPLDCSNKSISGEYCSSRRKTFGRTYRRFDGRSGTSTCARPSRMACRNRTRSTIALRSRASRVPTRSICTSGIRTRIGACSIRTRGIGACSFRACESARLSRFADRLLAFLVASACRDLVSAGRPSMCRDQVPLKPDFVNGLRWTHERFAHIILLLVRVLN